MAKLKQDLDDFYSAVPNRKRFRKMQSLFKVCAQTPLNADAACATAIAQITIGAHAVGGQPKGAKIQIGINIQLTRAC